MPFQFNTKKVFLTYAQCGDTTKEDAANFIATLNPLFYVIAIEFHADGGKHLHVVVGWASALRTRNERFFDFNGLHPNITSVRSIARVLDYVRKDGDWLSFGPVPDTERKDAKWSSLIEDSESPEDFMAEAQARFPREFVLQNEAFRAFSRNYFNSPEVYEPQHTVFQEHEQLDFWVREVLNVVCV